MYHVWNLKYMLSSLNVLRYFYLFAVKLDVHETLQVHEAVDHKTGTALQTVTSPFTGYGSSLLIEVSYRVCTVT